MDRSDSQLISDYFTGDEKSLDVLVGRYFKPIYAFIFRYVGNARDAEDIAQEAFVKAWRNLKKFNRDKSFRTWIFSIAKNSCVDFFKKKKTIPFSDFDTEEGGNLLADTLADPAPLPREILERADTTKTLRAALEKLSPDYRMVLYLRYNDHFTFKEIGEALKESLNTVKSRHRRAIIKLREILADKLEEI